MNANTVTSIGSLYPSAHVFNVAPQTAAQLGTTARAFLFTGSGTVATTAVPSGSAILGSVTPFDPESNASLASPFGSQLVGRSRAGRPYFNSGSFDGRPFIVRAVLQASLTAAGGGATTVLFALLNGTSATLGSDTVIANTGAAVSIAATKVSFLSATVEAYLQWDSTSQALHGEYTSWIGGSVDTSGAATIHQVVQPVALLNAPVTGITAASGLSFLASCTIGTTAANAGTVSLVELSIEQL